MNIKNVNVENRGIKVRELIEISVQAQPAAIFRVRELADGFSADQRLPMMELTSARFQFSSPNAVQEDWLWAIPRAACGDSPQQYHPKFLMALLSSLPAKAHNSQVENFLNWQFPLIAFATDEWTRRSMTLNGMRMSTEYFASDSPRVLQLVEQRLQAGQADVVHDVMVYLMQRVLELHALADEERALQAESLAAYLGLNMRRVQELLFDWPLQNAHVTQEIKNGFAGTPRQMTDISALIENQLARFCAAFEELKNQEDKVLRLLDEVALRFYHFNHFNQNLQPTDC